MITRTVQGWVIQLHGARTSDDPDRALEHLQLNMQSAVAVFEWYLDRERAETPEPDDTGSRPGHS